ncbi:MAG: hypothetical protein ACXVGH_01150 [Mycobacteriales bacterium]
MTRSLILRLLTGAALVGIAVVHLDIAGTYAGLGKTPLALNQQFYAQAVVAFVLAAALLVRPRPLVWLVTAGFAAGSLAVLIYSRYKCLPIYGFDGCFQESWSVKGAKPAAWCEAAALALTSAGLATSLHSAPLLRRGHRTAASV